MGIINDAFSQDKLSLNKFGEILNYLINISPNKVENKKILEEIGLINEYKQIIIEIEPNLNICYSKNHKIIKNLKFLVKMRINFLEWMKLLFDITKDDLDSIEKLNSKIEQIKSKKLTKEYFRNNIKKNIFKSKNINKLINYGIPPNLRLFIWDIIISEKYNNFKIFNYEEELKEYRILLSKNKPNPQINKDINRTFIKEEDMLPSKIQILKNVLNCINVYNKSGYCQGMNYIVGFLLKITNFNEVMTFYFYKNILKDIKGYFEENLPLLNANVKIFENYFYQLYPKIYKHFQKYEIINEFYITKWLQTLLTMSLPFEELSIIWDILLIRGFDFIVFICLAFFDFIGDNILKLKESADIINCMDKTLNPEGENLIQANIKFFEQIDEYIIPINEILEKAQEIEKKILNNKNNIEQRKSDNLLYNFKSNNLNEKNITQKKFNNIDNNRKFNNYYSNKNLATYNNIFNNETNHIQNQFNQMTYFHSNNINPNLLYNRINYSNKYLSYNPK